MDESKSKFLAKMSPVGWCNLYLDSAFPGKPKEEACALLYESTFSGMTYPDLEEAKPLEMGGLTPSQIKRYGTSISHRSMQVYSILDRNGIIHGHFGVEFFSDSWSDGPAWTGRILPVRMETMTIERFVEDVDGIEMEHDELAELAGRDPVSWMEKFRNIKDKIQTVDEIVQHLSVSGDVEPSEEMLFHGLHLRLVYSNDGVYSRERVFAIQDGDHAISYLRYEGFRSPYDGRIEWDDPTRVFPRQITETRFLEEGEEP